MILKGDGMIKGECLCGEIQFQAEETPGLVFNCHCMRCRKSSGSAFATQIFAKRDTLKFTSGEGKLSEYESIGGIRAFCSNCGSRLMNFGKEGFDYLSIAVSAIDDPNRFKPSANCFVESKLSWCQLDTEVRCFETFPVL